VLAIPANEEKTIDDVSHVVSLTSSFKNGKLVWETKSNGSSAFWTGKDYNGVKAKTGIYTVFISNEDGSVGCISKVAVIE
jgi:hypothetical protein